MTNFVFYDFETSSSNKQWGQIIEIGAILTDDELNELHRFESKCRLSPGIIPEAMSLIVSNTTPKRLKETNLSHYQMVRQFVEKHQKSVFGENPKSSERCKKPENMYFPFSRKTSFLGLPLCM